MIRRLLFKALRVGGRKFPKDYAYCVYSEFGPQQSLPRVTRIRKQVPNASSGDIQEWIKEFKLVDALVWKLARQGGSVVLGEAKVKQRLMREFPFLVNKGLKQAAFLVSYYAWHEGYDKEPERDSCAEA